MENDYKKALSEVVEILNHSEKEIIDKIPKKIMDYFYENRDKEYNVNIDFNNPKWEDYIKEDSKALLALIYRDYLVTPEERNKLIQEEKEEEEKYSYEKMFEKNEEKKNTVELENAIEKDDIINNELVEVQKTSWFKKIIEKIIAFFKK